MTSELPALNVLGIEKAGVSESGIVNESRGNGSGIGAGTARNSSAPWFRQDSGPELK